MFTLLFSALFFLSCKKDDATVDELRYRKYWSKHRTTTPVKVDTTKTPTGNGSTGTGTGTTGTGTTGTGTGTGTGTTTPGTASDGKRSNLVLESTFESGSSGWNITDQIGTSYGAGISSDFARAGSKSMRIELRRGDPLVSSSARAEIQPNAGSSNSASSEAWFGFSMYVPSDWFVSTNPESPIQFHQAPYVDGSEPVGFWIDGANFEMMITKGKNAGNTYIKGPAVKKGAWNDVVLHVKWDAGSNGIVEAWVNGTQFADYKGITNYPGQGYYTKVGAYKWYWQDPSTKDNGSKRVYYFDEFRIGNASATYNDVAP